MLPITLNRLERPEVETMVGHLAGGRPLPGEVVDHIVAKADGVPLYVEELRAAVRSAETLGHPLTPAQTLCYVAQVHILRREPSAAADYAGRALKICEEQRIANFHATALVPNGWALCASGESEKGTGANWTSAGQLWCGDIPTCVPSISGRRAIGDRQTRSGACIGYRRAEGDRKNGGAPFAAELHRLRGEALLAGAGTVNEAEAAVQQGIEVACRQNAKSWELRCAMSLARLRRQQGRAARGGSPARPNPRVVYRRLRYH